MSFEGDHLRRCGQRRVVGRATGGRPALVPCLRGTQHLHGSGLLEEGESPGGRDALMATLAEPITTRPNVASANIQLPGVESYEQVDRDIAGTLQPTKGWFALLGIAIAFFLWGAGNWVYQIYWGLGSAGYTPPVMWVVYFISFVFWVGIGHAGTLISAILYLFRAGFRTTIYRCAEAMTVFAVMTAGLFPIIHIGRPWKFFWLVPYPNWRLIWPNFKSPLVWDVFAISTYLTVSATFLYFGLLPDP